MPTTHPGSVEMVYDVHGAGDPLVMLHPAGTDARAFAANVPGLSQRLRLYVPDRRGHGRTPDAPGPISFQAMAGDMIAFLETVVGGPAFLLGYSDGAIVALLVAVRRPDLVRALVFVAGVFHRDGWVEGVLDADAAPPDFMRAAYAQLSPDGGEHFEVVARKLAAEHRHEPSLSAHDLQAISTRTLVMVGDDDEVSLEHALEMYRRLPNAELAVVPGTSHGLLPEKPQLCNALALDFLTQPPVATFAPIRRRAATAG